MDNLIRKVKKKSTGKYYYREQIKGKRMQITVEASNKEEACEKIEQELGITTSQGGITLEQLSKKYIDFKENCWEEKTRKFHLANHKSLFDYFKLEEPALKMTLEKANGYRRHLEKRKLAQPTVLHRIKWLKGLYRFATKAPDLRNQFPFHFLDLFSTERPNFRKKGLPEKKQIIDFFDQVSEWNRTIALVLCCTGMRSFEARSIRLSWINWEDHEINIPVILEEGRKTKNKMARSVPMIYLLKRVLIDHVREKGIRGNELLFTGKDGGIRDESMRGISRAWKRVNLDFSTHTFRNIFTSFLSTSFTNSEISNMTGWIPFKMVDHYNRLYGTYEYKEERLKKMGQTFSFLEEVARSDQKSGTEVARKWHANETPKVSRTTLDA